jgi:hypothetical protein
MWDKMDDEKKEKMLEKLKKMGIDESMIDEHTMHIAKKLSFSIMKLRFILDKKGVKADKANEVIDMLVKKAMEKDLDKIKKWKAEHSE